MKHEWKKSEKDLYLPKNKPSIIQVPAFNFYVIEGQGNPNDSFFGKYIEALYALSYAIKMSPKKGIAPENYVDYTVYPLEGIWDITEEAKKKNSAILDKNTLVFKLMIRQPDFVTQDYANKIIELTKKVKDNDLISKVEFVTIEDGLCVQMLHIGSYDSEPESFKIMEKFTNEQGYNRLSKVHREIYLSDARKVTADKLKTVLRFQVVKL